MCPPRRNAAAVVFPVAHLEQGGGTAVAGEQARAVSVAACTASAPCWQTSREQRGER
jgi:hypothetical protein